MGVITDPLADMLTRIRNATKARREYLLVPHSKLKLQVAQILKRENFIKGYEVVKAKPHAMIRMDLRFVDKHPAINGLRAISKPGLRVYVPKERIPRVYGGLGIAILSTSQGLMTGHEAHRNNTGGEVLCYIW